MDWPIALREAGLAVFGPGGDGPSRVEQAWAKGTHCMRLAFHGRAYWAPQGREQGPGGGREPWLAAGRQGRWGCGRQGGHRGRTAWATTRRP